MDDLIEKIKKSEKSLFVGLAGPGTGKSYTFKTIIKLDEYKGKKILILSFINKLINDLSNELKDFDNVEVLTLHAFAKRKIGKVDLDEYLDDYISDDSFLMDKGNILRESKFYEEKFYENNLAKIEKAFYVERKTFYQNTNKLYSFASIIYAANQYFQEDESRIPKYDLILIDEFQDFNRSEYELIKLLNKKNKMILVGDDDQSLYDFKHAKPEQIRALYKDVAVETFSFNYCYRCTEVIVNATNDLIKNAKTKGLLMGRLDKNFLYPGGIPEKNEASLKYPQIDFIPSAPGNLLICKLAQSIKEDIANQIEKRVLILAPNYLKSIIYDGLIDKGFNIVDIELFSSEECNKIKHKKLIKIFENLVHRKTDNLSLRGILFLYLSSGETKKIIIQKKKIWYCLEKEVRERIEKDIEIFKKVKKGKEKLKEEELKRFSEIFDLKNILAQVIKGFKPVMKNSVEVEMTTTRSSKGLWADYVYYIGIDDRNMVDLAKKDFTDEKICEFLVGITRAKKKLTLIALWDKYPKILEFINREYINIKNEK